MKYLWLSALLAMSGNVVAWPQWVIQPQQSEQQLVGVGVGDNRLQAREQALAEIVTQLSVSVATEQTQYLSKSANVSYSGFEQTTSLRSIPFDIAGVQELNSAEYEGQIALLLGVDKALLAQTLSSTASAVMAEANLSGNAPIPKFISAIQHLGNVTQVKNYLAATRGLGYANTELEAQHQQVTAELNKALAGVAIEVIGAQQLAQIKASIASAFGTGGAEKLWVKPELKWRSGKQGGKHISLAQLQISYQQARSPFTVVYSQTLRADGSAVTQAASRQQAMDAILEQLKLPPSEWNTGSAAL